MLSSPFASFLKMPSYFAKNQTMRKLLLFTYFLSMITFGCSDYHFEIPKEEFPISEARAIKNTCPIDCCQIATIELSLLGYNYSAPFTCYEWTDWGTGLNVSWTDGGRIMFFTFPNHRICNSEFRICAGDVCDCKWQPIESCPKNNTLTVALDSCLFGQPTLFLDVFLQDK